MSDWITDKASTLRAAREREKLSNELITVSGYWASLSRQIERDVVEMNLALKDFLRYPVEVTLAHGECRIIKNTLPAVTIYLRNKGREIEVETAVKRSPESAFKRKTQTLDVISDGDLVYLKLRRDVFLVPTAASEFILTPIADALDDG